MLLVQSFVKKVRAIRVAAERSVIFSWFVFANQNPLQAFLRESEEDAEKDFAWETVISLIMIQVSTTVRLLYCKTIPKLFKKPSHVLFKDVIKKTRKQLLALLSLAVSLSKQTWAKDALFDCEGEKQTEQHC